MQINAEKPTTIDAGDESRLTCQVNVRMTEAMRDELDSRAKEQWTSASQIARLAVAKELDRLDRLERDEAADEVPF